MKKSHAAPSVEKLKAAVIAAQEAKEAHVTKEELVAQIEPAPAQSNDEEDDVDEIVNNVADEGPAMLESLPEPPGDDKRRKNKKEKERLKEKKKEKGAARTLLGGRPSRSTAASSMGRSLPAPSSVSEADVDGASVRSGPGSAFQRWSKELDIEGMLAGRKFGTSIHNVTKVLGALERGSETHASEAVLLRGHVSLCKEAQKLLPSNIHTLSPSDRQAILQELKAAGVKIPPFTAGTLVTARVKEEESMRTRVSVLTPMQQPVEEFDSLKPTLSASGLDDTEMAKAISRGLLCSTLLPLIRCPDPDSKKEMVIDLAKSVIDLWGKVVAEDECGPITTSTLQNMIHIARFMLLILTGDLPETAEELDASSVASRILEARSGPKLVVKQACGSPVASVVRLHTWKL